MTIKLRYIGKVYGVDHLGIDTRMWDVYAPGSLCHKTTLTIAGMKEWGIL